MAHATKSRIDSRNGEVEIDNGTAIVIYRGTEIGIRVLTGIGMRRNQNREWDKDRKRDRKWKLLKSRLTQIGIEDRTGIGIQNGIAMYPASGSAEPHAAGSVSSYGSSPSTPVHSPPPLHARLYAPGAGAGTTGPPVPGTKLTSAAGPAHHHHQQHHNGAAAQGWVPTGVASPPGGAVTPHAAAPPPLANGALLPNGAPHHHLTPVYAPVMAQGAPAEQRRLDEAIVFLRDHSEVVGARMEERLDDAINVLRNHAEAPELYPGEHHAPPHHPTHPHHATTPVSRLGVAGPHPHEAAVKMERHTLPNTKKRKEPPDSGVDSKPSSSGSADALAAAKAGTKRSRRYCSSADEDDLDPDTKAARERERRQANNVRE
ncbi:Protein daughterless, partial [Eumeta japonica]